MYQWHLQNLTQPFKVCTPSLHFQKARYFFNILTIHSIEILPNIINLCQSRFKSGHGVPYPHSSTSRFESFIEKQSSSNGNGNADPVPLLFTFSPSVMNLGRQSDLKVYLLTLPLLEGNPGLVVMEYDSCLTGRGSESRCSKLDGHDIYSH